jgi:hypothetical protein
MSTSLTSEDSMSTQLPHDVSDLELAPVALAVETRIAHLAGLDDAALAREIDAVSERPTRDESERRSALLAAVEGVVALHGWKLSWDDARGIRLTHGSHSFVLGVSASMRRYVFGVPVRPARVG